METLGWVMFIFVSLLCWFFFRQYWRSLTREGYLADFVIYLLLSDSIRNTRKRELEQIIQEDERNMDQLHLSIRKLIINLAGTLAQGKSSNPGPSSILGAFTMILRVKKGEPIL